MWQNCSFRQGRQLVQSTQKLSSGTIASPSRPSVKFTALDAPTITTIANGTYKRPWLVIAFRRYATPYRKWSGDNSTNISVAISG